jgi:cephalosporin hydroxylase
MFDLPGWCPTEKARDMRELILATRPAVCVEIGVFGGASLIPTAEALRDAGGGVVYGVDPWTTEAALEGDHDRDSSDWWAREDMLAAYVACMTAITSRGLWPYVRILAGPSQCVASAIFGIDILHIDGNHSEIASCRDVYYYLPRVRPGGYVWMDDTDWRTTQKAAGLLRASCEVVTDRGRYRLYQLVKVG